jgi:hypothetical protein
VMGDKCKKNLVFHENTLISHYFSFWLYTFELQKE